jgi:two-component system sensor histidine kinase RpfC
LNGQIVALSNVVKRASIEAKPFEFLRKRLHDRADSEHEQAILRIVIVAIVLVVMALRYSPSTDDQWAIAFPVIYLGFSLVLLAGICIWPAQNVQRRLLGALGDNVAATAVMFLAGDVGTAMIGVYLFVSFGNGFRYGRRYLFISQVLAILGFASVLLIDDHWANHQTAGWCLMVALIVLPLYVSTLLKRVHEAQRRAEEASKAKSTFLANMSHEMRTPLNGIAGVSELLQASNLDTHQTELVRLLRHSVALMRSLIDEVLDISKIEAGQLSIELVDFDLHATINSLATLMRQHATSKGLRLYAMIDPAIDYQLRSDPHHLRQILLNLLSNAVKFTERGTIELLVKLVEETNDGLRVRFEVRDTGIGISQEAQARIFERFVQADNSTTRRYGGTGLGTTIAKQLVELMGGQIGVESTIGAGSTFWFELPLLRSMSTPTASDTRPANVGILVAGNGVSSNLATLIQSACGRVDVVSDASRLASRVEELESTGHSVTAVFATGDVEAARNAFEALATERRSSALAMIYLSPASVGTEGMRLNGIDGAMSVPAFAASPRILRNAIHAATSREPLREAEVIALADALKQQRQPLKVLVAEDNTTNQTIIRKLLESAGHTVFIAQDGEEALDVFVNETVEFAILDFNMPARTGTEVTSAIRTMEPTGTRTPIIVLSASVTPETREHALRAGADEFIGKPFEAGALLQTIDRVARRVSRMSQHPSKRTASQASVTELELPVLDAARLAAVEQIAPNPAFLGELLRGFAADVRMLLARIDDAVRKQQYMQVADAAHAVRGAAVGIGARRLSARAEVLEGAAKSGDEQRTVELAAELHQVFRVTGEQLSEYAVRTHRMSL